MTKKKEGILAEKPKVENTAVAIWQDMNFNDLNKSIEKLGN